jgi:hypothetical protein
LKSELRRYRKVTEEEDEKKEEALHVLGFRGKGCWEAGQPVCPGWVEKASCLYMPALENSRPSFCFSFFFKFLQKCVTYFSL